MGTAINAAADLLRDNRLQESRVKANGSLISFQLDQDQTLDTLNRTSEEFSAIDEGFAQQFYKKADGLLETIDDDATREYIQNELINLYGTYQLRAQDLERTRNAEAMDFELVGQMNTAMNVVRSDPAQLEEQIDKLTAAINATGGIVPIETIRERVREFLSGATESAIRGRISESPRLVLEELQLDTLYTGGQAALLYQESGGNPQAVNQFGHAGYYQFGAPRLTDLGVYTPGANESLGNWSDTASDVEGKWSGTFNIPNFPNIKTLNDFLASPDAQHYVYRLHEQRIDQEIADNGFDGYIGQTVNEVRITTQGLRNMLHFAGVEGTRKALNGEDVRDANGTSAIEYAALGQSTVNPNEVLTPEQKERLLQLAESEWRAQLDRSSQAEDDAWRQMQRQQSLNYSALQGMIARGEATEPMLVDAIGRQLISGEQYRVLRDDLRQERDDEGNPEAALRHQIAILQGDETLEDVLGDTSLSTDEVSDLATLSDEVGRRGGALAQATVQRELDRLESIVGGQKLPGGAYVDPNAHERVANAMQEATDRILAEPENARTIVDEAIQRYRILPTDLSTLPRIPYWNGARYGTREELTQRLGDTFRAIEEAYSLDQIGETEYLRMLSDLERYKETIEAME